MNIKRIVEIVLLAIYFCYVLMAQAPENNQENQKEQIKTYIAAKDNWKTIPFVVSNAKKALAKPPLIESLSGAEIIKFDSQIVVPVVGNKVTTTDKKKGANTDQEFAFKFIPREVGEYRVILRGFDAARPHDKDGIDEKEVKLKVVYPFFKKIKDAPPKQIYEGEDLKIDFSVNGFEDNASYKVIRTWKGVTDTIKETPLIIMSKENFVESDVGNELKFIVLYQDNIFYYIEGDSASLSSENENKIYPKPQPSIFTIQVIKQVPKVFFANTEVPYGERIEFYAYYQGKKIGKPVLKNEIKKVKVINLQDNKNIFQKYDMIEEGTFVIYVKPGLNIPSKDGKLKVKVTVDLGQYGQFDEEIILKKIKSKK